MRATLNTPKFVPLTRTWRRAWWAGVCFTALVWLSGCQKQSQVAAEVNLAGTYTLSSINGNPVPSTITHEGASLTIKSGTFEINADGTCRSKMNFTLPSGVDSTREVKATYTREGTKLTMRWEGAGMTSGTVQDNTFTMNNEGMVLAYKK